MILFNLCKKLRTTNKMNQKEDHRDARRNLHKHHQKLFNSTNYKTKHHKFITHSDNQNCLHLYLIIFTLTAFSLNGLH